MTKTKKVFLNELIKPLTNSGGISNLINLTGSSSGTSGLGWGASEIVLFSDINFSNSSNKLEFLDSKKRDIRCQLIERRLK